MLTNSPFFYISNSSTHKYFDSVSQENTCQFNTSSVIHDCRNKRLAAAAAAAAWIYTYYYIVFIPIILCCIAQ